MKYREFYKVYESFFEYLSEVRGEINRCIIHYSRTSEVPNTSFGKYTKDERYVQFYELFKMLFNNRSGNEEIKRIGLDLPAIYNDLSRQKALFETSIENFKVIKEENPDNEKLEIIYNGLYKFFVKGIHHSFIRLIISKNRAIGGNVLREYSREYYGGIGRIFFLQ